MSLNYSKVRYFIFISILTLLATSSVVGQSLESRVTKIIIGADSLANPNQSLTLLNTILSEVEKASDSTKSQYYYLLGVSHGMLYNIDTSKLYFQKSLASAEKSGSILSQLGSLNGLANLATITSDNELAQSYYEMSLQLAESESEDVFIKWQARILGNLGGIFFDLNDFQAAFDYAKKAYHTAQSIPDSTGMARYLIQIGYSLSKLNKLDSALKVNLISTEILERIENSYLLTFQYYNLGEILMNSGNLAEAEASLLKCAELAREYNEAETLADCLNTLAEISFKKGDFSESKKLLERSLEISLPQGMLPHQQKSYIIYYQVELAQNNFEEAIIQLSKHQQVKDSLMQSETLKSIEEFQVKYETAEKEILITEANAQIEKKQRFQIFLLTIIGISLVVIFLLVQRNKLKRALLSQEIDTLRIQIKSALDVEAVNFKIDRQKLDQIALTPITEREVEILNFAMIDLTNSEIAEKAFVSVNTVKFHLKNIYGKLGVGNTREALQSALQSSKVTS